MNDLVTRLRDNFEGCGGHDENMEIRKEAAAELERIYTSMALGPVAWSRRGSYYNELTSRKPADGEWTPLYFIPAPESKP